jgi:hypothetical protein
MDLCVFQDVARLVRKDKNLVLNHTFFIIFLIIVSMTWKGVQVRQSPRCLSFGGLILLRSRISGGCIAVVL